MQDILRWHLTAKCESLVKKPLQFFERKLIETRKQSNLMRTIFCISTVAPETNLRTTAVGFTFFATMDLYLQRHGLTTAVHLFSFPDTENTLLRI
jgi:hypothetical protein